MVEVGETYWMAGSKAVLECRVVSLTKIPGRVTILVRGEECEVPANRLHSDKAIPTNEIQRFLFKTGGI